MGFWVCNTWLGCTNPICVSQFAWLTHITWHRSNLTYFSVFLVVNFRVLGRGGSKDLSYVTIEFAWFPPPQASESFLWPPLIGSLLPFNFLKCPLYILLVTTDPPLVLFKIVYPLLPKKEKPFDSSPRRLRLTDPLCTKSQGEGVFT